MVPFPLPAWLGREPRLHADRLGQSLDARFAAPRNQVCGAIALPNASEPSFNARALAAPGDDDHHPLWGLGGGAPAGVRGPVPPRPLQKGTAKMDLMGGESQCQCSCVSA